MKTQMKRHVVMGGKISKLFAVLLTVLLVFANGAPIFALAEYVAAADDGIVLSYRLNGNEATITDCDEDATDEEVMAAFAEIAENGYTVINIGDHAFSNCTDLTSITIPDSVANIGVSAFSRCRSLKSISLPNGLTSISKMMFYVCENLISIMIPDSVTSIDEYAFGSCRSLTNVTIPDGVTSIGDYAFDVCRSLTNITLSADLTSIGDNAFNGCAMTSIAIPDGVTSIGDFAFDGCHSLTNITLSTDLTSIGNAAFRGCPVTSITIPDRVMSIGDEAFQSCHGLTNITIPASVTSIGNMAFAFNELITITVDSGNLYYANDSVGVLFNKEKTVLIQYPTNNTRSDYTIPAGVVSISERAFYHCRSLTSITLPDSLTDIGEQAFANNFGLTNLIIPTSVTSIGYGAFLSCSLTNNITIPASVTSIGAIAFAFNELITITVDSGNLYYSNDATGVLFNKEKTVLVQYPTGNTRAEYAIPVGVTSIGEDAFSGCKLTSVTIPNSLTSIGGYSAFVFCSNLAEITISGGMTDLPLYFLTEDTFQNDLRLYVPESVISVGGNSSTEMAASVTLSGKPIIYAVKGSFIAIWAQANLPAGKLHIIDQTSEEPSSNATLSNLRLSGGTLSPAFNAAEIVYTANVSNGVSSVTVTATPADSKATVDGDGVASAKALNVGSNTLEITVTAEDQVTTLTYSIIITRADSNEPVFSSGVLSYILNGTDVMITTCDREATDEDVAAAFAEIEDNGYKVIGIDSEAFYACTELTVLTIPASVSNIKGDAFVYSELSKIIVDPENEYYSSDDDGVLFNKEKTVLIQYPPGNTRSEYRVPNSVTSIGYSAFARSDLTDIIIPDSVVSIGSSAFFGARSLSEITIPDGVTSIEASTFFYCNALTSITIPESVTKIGSFAFADTGLTDINIPAGVVSIADGAFSTHTLINITVDPDNANYSSDANGVLFDKEKTVLIQYPPGNTMSEYTIPASVTDIGYEAFFSCDSLTSINLPDILTSIGSRAFYGCTSLGGIIIPDGVTRIGNWAFNNCTSLFEITIADGMKDLPLYFLTESMLQNDLRLYIPESVTSIGGSASTSLPTGVTLSGKPIIYAVEGSFIADWAEANLPANKLHIIAKTPEEASSNATLSALRLSSGTLSPAFSAGTTSYTANVANSVSSVTVTARPADSKATVTGDGIGTAKSLNVGANTLTIVVTAEDGVTTKTYSIIVTRASSSSGGVSGGGSVSSGNGVTNPPISVPSTSSTALVAPESAPLMTPVEANGFNDVPANAWFAEAVKFITARGIMAGSGDVRTFQPQQTMTRAMLITALARLDGIDTTTGDTWYSAAVSWGVSNGITDGQNLNDAVSREQIVTMLWRYAEQPQGAASFDGVPDAGSIKAWAVDAFRWAMGTGVISGYEDKTVRPQNSASRAELATILMRFISAE
jgi:hypothetical protein